MGRAGGKVSLQMFSNYFDEGAGLHVGGRCRRVIHSAGHISLAFAAADGAECEPGGLL